MAVEKVYLATKEDLAKVNTTDFLKPALEIKKNTHPTKTINDVALKSIIYIPETKNGTTALKPYILVEKNENNVVVLRQYLDTKGALSTIIRSNDYPDGMADVWLNETFVKRFSNNVQNYMVNNTIIWHRGYNPGGNRNIIRKIYLPSAYEIGISLTYNDGSYEWFDSASSRIAYTEDLNPVASSYWTRTQMANSTTYEHTSNSGAYDPSVPTVTTNYYRPCISFSKALPLNDENEVIDGIIYENEPVDTIAEDNKYYRIKDTNAVHLTDVKTPVSSANKIVTENELIDKQDKGKATVNNTEYSLGRHTLTVTDGSTTTSYNFLTAEAIENGN